MAQDINFVGPRDVVILGNDRWEDDTVSDIDFTSQVSDGQNLAPGERLTAVEITATQQNVYIAPRSLATTPHPGDIDGDGQAENIVKYRLEQKPESPSDTYNPLPGASTTMPFGQLSDPVEFIPGSYIGPISSFRVVFENRSNGFSNPLNVSIDRLGAELHARVLRNIDPSDPQLVQPTEGSGSERGDN